MQEGTSPVFGILDLIPHGILGKSDPLNLSQGKWIATKSASMSPLGDIPPRRAKAWLLPLGRDGNGLNTLPLERIKLMKDLRSLVWLPLMGVLGHPRNRLMSLKSPFRTA